MRQIDKYKNRRPTSFTLSLDTLQKLNDYAIKHHTNKSQALTDLIWMVSDVGVVNDEFQKPQ